MTAREGVSRSTVPPLDSGQEVNVLWAGGAWHLLFFGTLAAATASALGAVAGGRVVAAVILSASLGVWYFIWTRFRVSALRSSGAGAAIYFAGAAVLWIALLAVDERYGILAVTAYAQVFIYLPRRKSILGALLVTLIPAVSTVIRSGWSIEAVLFPLGSFVSIALIVLYLRSVEDRSAERARLIAELQATRAELAVAERNTGTLEERHRLAREIHDSLAQGLTSIIMLLQAAQKVIDPDDIEASELVARSTDAAREALAEARRFIWDLRPQPLDSGSLAEALERLTARLQRETDLVSQILVTGNPVALPPAIEATLLRLAQEALSNVRRHAQAKEVTVTLSYVGSVVALDVCDDGVGFDTSLPRSGPTDTSGFGLLAMRERVKRLGGSLVLESVPGGGTTVAVELPLECKDRETNSVLAKRVHE